MGRPLLLSLSGGEKPALTERAGWPVELKGMVLSEADRQKLNKSENKARERRIGRQLKHAFKKFSKQGLNVDRICSTPPPEELFVKVVPEPLPTLSGVVYV